MSTSLLTTVPYPDDGPATGVSVHVCLMEPLTTPRGARWIAMALLLLATPVATAIDATAMISLTTFTSSANGDDGIMVQYPNGSNVVIANAPTVSQAFTLSTATVEYVAHLPRSPINMSVALVSFHDHLSTRTFTGLGIRALNQELAVDHNGIAVVVTSLNLSHNSLASIDRVHFPLRLTSLDVSYNEITRVGALSPTIDTDFMGSSLSRLWMDYNRIETLENASFPNGMRFLSLRHNQLTVLSRQTRWPLALEALYLDHNALSAIHTTTFPPSLHTLSVAFNNLTTFLATNLPTTLVALNLTGNPLTTITATDSQFTAVLAKLTPTTLLLDSRLSNAACAPGSETRLLWSVHPICILKTTTEAPPAPPSTHVRPSWIIYVACSVTVVLAAAAVLLQRRRRRPSAAAVDTSDWTLFVSTHSKPPPSATTAMHADDDDDDASPSDFVANDIRVDAAFVTRHRLPTHTIHLEEAIATGAFGMVFRAVMTQPHQANTVDVAVKRLLPERTHDADAVEAFMDEIYLLALLPPHPHIIRFVGVAYTSLQTLSLVTEFAPRGDLWSWLDDSTKRPWTPHVDRAAPSKLGMLQDVVAGLAFLHALRPRPVLHRDIKARNVLLDADWRAKLTDFGSSRPCAMDVTMTAEIGTVPWMAPEVLRGARYDESADVYSLGVLVAEMDTCAVPYASMVPSAIQDCDGDTVIRMTRARIATMVAAGQLKPSFSPTCPRPLLKVAMQCLAYNPHARPTAAQVTCMLFEAVERR
ncbi:Aste57867_16431 [Aphanomyces stellatus]|uniref:Aste57867_16431 protein n=1 Tax=Aphanomyces stellatus TaxID=120398 RepID=A0A485L5F8_9STRA|nr:hypothetical protein As57867_016374 [Aphanomyces stellatus]VFT93206.1 Aste57867_16431 [Aphanomyces stellatus]